MVVLIEPNPFVAVALRATLAGLVPEPIVVGSALGAAPGSASLNIWRDPSADPGASLLEHVSGGARTVVEVEVTTLDAILEGLGLMPDLVKLDLQGGELAALRGSAITLQRAEMMMIEFGCLDAYLERTTPRDLLDLMFDSDYVLYDIVDCHYRPFDGALTGGDFLFVKATSALRAHRGWE